MHQSRRLHNHPSPPPRRSPLVNPLDKRLLNLPAIDVAPNQAKFLYLLAKLANAKKILEVGTLGGYSAIWFAKAVGRTGKVTTLEIDPVVAEVARGNIERAGFQDVMDVIVGPAVETLKGFSEREGEERKPVFDFVFVDADKENALEYFMYALEFAKVRTVIVVDNVASGGRVADEECVDSRVLGTRRLL